MSTQSFSRVSSAAALLLWIAVAPALTQNANDGFDPNANERVLAIAMQPDGKLLIGGTFTEIGGVNRGGLARLNVDGTVDQSFHPPPGLGTGFSPVYAIAVEEDGQILVGGFFQTARTRHLTRLGADGSEDTNFLGQANNTVHCLSTLPGGQILVGGYFSSLSDQPRTGLGRLNADGSLDNSFDALANGGVVALQRLPDGRLVMGGQFTRLGGQRRNSLARLLADGTLDEFFDPGAWLDPNPDDKVFALAVQPNGQMLVGGYCTVTNDPNRRNLLHFNPEGSLDELFPLVTNGPVYSLTRQVDGKIVVGGASFNTGGLTPLGRLNPNGSVDESFRPAVGGSVHSLAVQADGKIVVGGTFTNLAGATRNRIGQRPLHSASNR